MFNIMYEYSWKNMLKEKNRWVGKVYKKDGDKTFVNCEKQQAV